MSNITAADLEAALTGNPEALDVHLALVSRDVSIDGHLVKIHCHCLTLDGNGRVQPRRLAEFMRNAVVDYAIPRSQLLEAKARDIKFNSSEAVTELVERAKRSFTDLATSGEGGEMLLFLLAERFLKLPQILCKMDLKTDTRMHYHGADGVYAGVTDDGLLKLYWGESKVYGDASAAIRECLRSLSPFLTEPDHEDAERERDLLLLSDKADLSDRHLTEAIKKYFDKSSVMSRRVRYWGWPLWGSMRHSIQETMQKGLLRILLKPLELRLLAGLIALVSGSFWRSWIRLKLNCCACRCHQLMDFVRLS